jgi:transposase
MAQAAICGKHLDRARAWALGKAGWARADIAREVGHDEKFVDRWTERVEATGSTQDQPRSGRPRVVTAEAKATLRKLMFYKEERSTRGVAAMMQAEGYSIGRESVRKAAREEKARPYHPRDKPSQPWGNQTRRWAFARIFKELDWTTIWFVDEKKFVLGSSPNKKNDVIWSDLPDAVPPHFTVKHGAKINAFAAFCADGTSDIHLFTENLTASLYTDILESVLLPATARVMQGRPWRLLQDSDPKHTAKHTTEWLDERKISYFSRAEWPPYSPDLNPIENAWAEVARRVRSLEPSNTKELHAAIRSAWADTMTDSFRRALVDSMPRRLLAVRRVRGGHTTY